MNSQEPQRGGSPVIANSETHQITYDTAHRWILDNTGRKPIWVPMYGWECSCGQTGRVHYRFTSTAERSAQRHLKGV